MSLIKLFWDVCAVKIGPQDVPASSFLLGLTLVAYFMTGAIAATLQWPVFQAVFAAFLDTVFLALIFRVLLWSRLLAGRYTQTLTALAGSGALMTLIALPLILWQGIVGATDGNAPTLPSWLLMVWTVWNIVVVGHIIRHALSTVLPLGIGLAALYALITFQLMRIILPN